MNIYCVKGVAAYHEFACATPFTEDGMWYVETCRSYEIVLISMIKTNFK
jgi:hypothetical protein